MPAKSSAEIEQRIIDTFATCNTVQDTVRALGGQINHNVVRRILRERGIYNGKTYRAVIDPRPVVEPVRVRVSTDALIGAYLDSPMGTDRAADRLLDVRVRFAELTR